MSPHLYYLIRLRSNTESFYVLCVLLQFSYVDDILLIETPLDVRPRASNEVRRMPLSVAFFYYGLKSVESCVIFRGTKNGVGRNNKPPAMRAETKSLYKKHLSDTIELFSHYCKKGKVFHGKTVIRSRPYKVDV